MTVSQDAAPRPERRFCVGDCVAYWRAEKNGNGIKARRPYWYGRALVCGRDGKNLLLSHGSASIREAPEQCRPATKSEEEAERLADELREAAENLRRQSQGEVEYVTSQVTDLREKNTTFR